MGLLHVVLLRYKLHFLTVFFLFFWIISIIRFLGLFSFFVTFTSAKFFVSFRPWCRLLCVPTSVCTTLAKLWSAYMRQLPTAIGFWIMNNVTFLSNWMLSTDGPSFECIEVVNALFLDATRWIISTCFLSAVAKKRFTGVLSRIRIVPSGSIWRCQFLS